MATYYWVGGTGTWDATTTTHWALSSGGTGGAGVPGIADDVVWDANSNATSYTVTANSTANCRSLTLGAPASGTVTMSGNGGTFNVYGGISIAATGVAVSLPNADWFFRATTTGWVIATNGASITASSGEIQFSGVGGGWTLGSALTLPGNNTGIFMAAGAFDTGGYAVSAGFITTSGSAVGSFNGESSTITVSNGWTGTGNPNITYSLASSTVIIAQTLALGNITIGTVQLGSGASGNAILDGPMTITTLTTGAFSTDYQNFQLFIATGPVTVGTFSPTTQANVTRRLSVISGTVSAHAFGETMSLIIGATGTLSNVDFADIAVTGAAAPISGTSLGDGGGNSGITFTSAKTVYLSSSASGTISWGSNIWATSSGGTVAQANYPLAQDQVYLDNSSGTSGCSVTAPSGVPAPSIDGTGRTNAITMPGPTLSCRGDLKLSSAFTMAAGTTVNIVPGGRSVSLVSAGVSFTSTVLIAGNGGSVTLAGALTTIGGLEVYGSSLNMNGYSVTASNFSTSTTFGTAASLTSGGGPLFLSAGGSFSSPFNFSASTFSMADNVPVSYTYTGAGSNTTFNGPASGSFGPSLSFTGGSFAPVMSGIFNSVDFTGCTGAWSIGAGGMSVLGNLTVASGMTVTAGANALTFAGTSGTQVLTSNGKTLDFPITVNGAGGTTQLSGALTMGSTRTLTVTNGTFDANNYNVTAGIFASANSNTRGLKLGSGTWTLSGSGTAWNVTTTGLTITPSTSTISLTSASAKTFAGGGGTYYNLNQGGAGALTISG